MMCKGSYPKKYYIDGILVTYRHLKKNYNINVQSVPEKGWSSICHDFEWIIW